MKTVNVKIDLYKYDDLSEAAQRTAIWCTVNDLNDLEPFNGARYDDEDARDHIEANEYYFYSSGAAAHTLHYTGKTGEKSGKTFYINDGKEFEIK